MNSKTERPPEAREIGNPSHEDLDDTFRGVRARAHADDHYEGWSGRWYYNEHAVIIYDAECDDGEQIGAVTLSDPEIEHIFPSDPIEETRVVDFVPLSVADTDDIFTYTGVDGCQRQVWLGTQ